MRPAVWIRTETLPAELTDLRCTKETLRSRFQPWKTKRWKKIKISWYARTKCCWIGCFFRRVTGQLPLLWRTPKMGGRDRQWIHKWKKCSLSAYQTIISRRRLIYSAIASALWDLKAPVWCRERALSLALVKMIIFPFMHCALHLCTVTLCTEMTFRYLSNT